MTAIRDVPIWQVERDASGMPCRMYLVGWRQRAMRRRARRDRPVPAPVPEERQLELAIACDMRGRWVS